jgi:hypothetical protein
MNGNPTRLLAALAITLASLLSAPHTLAAPDCPQLSRVYFGNGVNVLRQDAEEALWPLAGLAEEAGVDDAEVALAYNPTDGLLGDVLETLKQKAAEDDRFSWFVANNILGYTLRGLAIPSPLARKYAPLVESIQNAVNEAVLKASGQPTAFYDATVGEHVSQYLTDIAAGNRVLVVAHSQGNLYANSAFGFVNAAAPEPALSLGITAVATPAETSQRGYVTSDHDFVINLIRSLGKTVLPANVRVPVALDDLTGHLFLSTYLNERKPARARVVSLLSKVAKATPYPPAVCLPPDPVDCGGEDSSGKASGFISVGGQQVHTLDVRAGQAVFLRVVEVGSTAFWPQLKVHTPSGKQEVNPVSATDVAATSFNASESGAYSLVIADNSSGGDKAGAYELYYSLAPGANEGCLLTSGGIAMGIIDKGDLDSYTFTATAGEGVQLRMVDIAGGTFWPGFEVYDPSGTRVVNPVSATDVAVTSFYAPVTGTYTIVAYDNSTGRASTGDYNLYFTRAPSANEGGPLSPGGMLSGAIDKGDLDSYTFTATAGQGVQLRLVDTAGGAFWPGFEVYDPSGTRVVNPVSATDVAATSFYAPASGTYTVVVYDKSTGSASTGDYNLYFTRAPSANEGGLLSSGGVTSGSIDKGDLDSYTFNATAGEGVHLRLVDIAGIAFWPGFEVYDPTGARVVNPVSATDVAVTSFYAPSTGVYTVVAYDNSTGRASTGDYNIYFTRAPSANEGGPLSSGGMLGGAIDKGDLDSYTFNATAGEGIVLRLVDVAGGAFWPGFEVYDPSGSRVMNPVSSTDVAGSSFYAPTSGTYTVIVYDNSTGSASTGDYNLYFTRALSANEGGPLSSGSTLSGVIDKGDLDSYTFAALAGASVHIELADVAQGPLWPAFEVYEPSGKRAVNPVSGADLASVTFKASGGGTFMLVVYDMSTGMASTGGYQLSLTITPP